MGVPNSEVGYTSAMPRREDHEVHNDMWGIVGGGGNEQMSWDYKTYFSVVVVMVMMMMIMPVCTEKRMS